MLGKDSAAFRGTFYSSDITTAHRPPQPTRTPPLWISSWGSTAGIRRVAELGDGWLASAYNTTPAAFSHALDQLEGAGRPATTFPNALATMWLHVTDRPAAAEDLINNVLAPMLNRPADDLQGLPIGSPEQCAERMSAYERAGAQRIFLWPIGDEFEQLVAFRTHVMPLLPTSV